MTASDYSAFHVVFVVVLLQYDFGKTNVKTNNMLVVIIMPIKRNVIAFT